MGMHVFAFTDGGRDATNVLAILNYRVANFEILQCNLVANWNVLTERATKFAVVLNHDAQHVHTSDEILGNDDADVITHIMHEQLRLLFHARRVSSRIA